MYSILVISHGDLAKELVKSAFMQTHKRGLVEAVSIYEDTLLREVSAKIREKICKMQELGDVVVLTDTKIGTPFNIIVKLMREKQLYHMTGMNLDLLVELIISSEEERLTEDICKEAIETARENLFDVSALLKGV